MDGKFVKERSHRPHALMVDVDVDPALAMRELIASEKYTVAVTHKLCDARRQRCSNPTSCCSICDCPTATAWTC